MEPKAAQAASGQAEVAVTLAGLLVAFGRAHVGHLLESLSFSLSRLLAVSPTSHLCSLRARNPDAFPGDPCFSWLQDPGTVDTMYSSSNGERVVWEGIDRVTVQC